MNELTPAERRALKARAHSLDPVILIGDKGLTGSVLAEIERAVKAHELVKIRVQAERDERTAILDEICSRTKASAVQHIGKVLVVFRAKPPEPPAPKVRRRAVRKDPASPGASAKPGVRSRTGSRIAPRTSRPEDAVFGRPRRPSTATGRASRPEAKGTGRPGSRTASPRRAPAHPPGRRRTS